MYAEVVTGRSIVTWLCARCLNTSFWCVNGCSVDNLKAAVTRASYYDPKAQRVYADHAEGYGFVNSPCPVVDPMKKGRFEAGVKYVKNKLAPLCTFRHLVDANTQLMQWVRSVSGSREHGATGSALLTRFAEVEQSLPKAQPSKPPEIPIRA